jgi:hypothetical protein
MRLFVWVCIVLLGVMAAAALALVVVEVRAARRYRRAMKQRPVHAPFEAERARRLNR